MQEEEIFEEKDTGIYNTGFEHGKQKMLVEVLELIDEVYVEVYEKTHKKESYLIDRERLKQKLKEKDAQSI